MISVTTSRLRVKVGSDYNYYYFSDSYTVNVNGTKSTIGKLIGYFEDDEDIYVYITLNSDDEITKIEAELGSASANTDYSGTIINVTPSTMSIRISAASTLSYVFSASPVIKIDGSAKTVTDLYNNWYYGETTYAKITLSNNKISRVEAQTEKAEGTLVSFSASSIIYIKNNGRVKNYNISNNVLVNIDAVRSDLDMLKSILVYQNNIEVVLTLENGKVIRITADTW